MALSDVQIRLILNASAAVVTFLFGAIVLAAGPRRAPNCFLAAFLFLIGANQAAEALPLLAPFSSQVELWFHIATVFAALDPFFLYAFASIYPERNGLNRPRYIVLVLAGSTILALLAPLMRRSPEAPSAQTVVIATFLSVFTVVVYTAVLVAAMRPLLAGSANPALRWLYLALCFAVIPSWARVSSELLAEGLRRAGLGWLAETTFGFTLGHFVLFALAFAAMLWTIRRARGPTPSVRRLLYVGAVGGFVLGMFIHQILGVIAAQGLELTFVGQSSAAVRWLLFSILVSMAILRYQMLDFSLAARRRSARIVLGFAFAGAAFLILKAVEGWTGDEPFVLRPIELIILGMAVLTSQSFRFLLDAVAEKMYGVPRPGRLAGRLEAYQAAVVQAQREGRSPISDPDLVRLRNELDLDADTVAVIERMAAATGEGPLVEGEVVAGRYRIRRFLGRGGGGRAFLARDEMLQRDVVLKEVLHEGADGGAGEDVAEARVAGSVGHPNVVTVYDALSRRGSHLVVTEYVSGGTLEDRLASREPMTLEEGARLADGILAGLAAVHERAIVHQDLKPSNILLAPDGVPKIGDFGTARLRRGTTLAGGERAPLRGTPEYMAPEVKAGQLPTPAADLYAVGRILVELLPGPVPAAAQRIIDRALAARPEDRWESAEEMRRALQEAVDETLRRGTRDSSARPRSRRPS